MAPPNIEYENAAEVRTVSGWVCKTCGRFCGDDENLARYCCSKFVPCQTPGCAGKAEKGYSFCKDCREKLSKERYLKLPLQPWDGVTPLVEQDDDRFFYDAEDLNDYLEDCGLEIEDLRLVVCKPCKKPFFEMAEFLCDYFGPENELDKDPKDIERCVNDWIEANVPVVWQHGKCRPTLESVRGEIA